MLPINLKNSDDPGRDVRGHVTHVAGDIFFEFGEALDVLIDGAEYHTDDSLVSDFHVKLIEVIKKMDELKGDIDRYFGED